MKKVRSCPWVWAAFISALIVLISLLFINHPVILFIDSVLETIFITLWQQPYSSLSILFTQAGSITGSVVILGLITAGLSVQQEWRKVFIITTASIGTLLLVTILKELSSIPRPEITLIPIDGFRFPSGHAAAGMIIGLSLIVALIHKHVSYIWKGLVILGSTLFALLMGGTRIYLNVHRPLDVLAGFAVAFCAFSLAMMLFRCLRR